MIRIIFVLCYFQIEGAETEVPPTVQTSVPRDGSKSRNSRQRADEAYRYNADDDLNHSIEELTLDNYLQKLFPGRKPFIFHI